MGITQGTRKKDKTAHTGAQVFVELLKTHKITHIFGYPGAVALPLFDALYDARDDIHVVVPRHEQGTLHMADGYARATGEAGVALVTSGPGATNAVTGIANAFMDSIPLVVFCAQVSTSVLGTDAFQESDITGITLPITKHSYLVKSVEELIEAVNEAFQIATTGRPGPVVIDIPVDVSAQVYDGVLTGKVHLPGYKPTMRGNAKQITQAAHAFKKSARPVFYVGGGVIASGAADCLCEIAEYLEAPVATTLMGRGAFPEDHVLWLGMPGMHGAKYTNYALTEADLICAVGVRFDDRVTGKISEFAPHANLIHIDIDPAEIGKIKQALIPIVGDANDVLARLLEVLKTTHVAPNTDDWLEHIAELKEKYPLAPKAGKKDSVIHPLEFIQILQQVAEADGKQAIYTTEVGQNQMWAAQALAIKEPRTFLSSGGLGTMGFGFPAAIGAAIAHPEKQVICVAGDGSIQMNIQELATALQEKTSVKVFILNNAGLGMIHQWQELFYDERYSGSEFENQCPDFVKLADAYGAYGARITASKDAEKIIKAALAFDGPALVDVTISRDELVFPMVAPGDSIAQSLGGNPGEGINQMIDSSPRAKGDN